jgi:hypothetical protein
MENLTQNTKSVAKNQDFFADNDLYKTMQGELEIYQFIAKSATHETTGARRLLDIGNGGVSFFRLDIFPMSRPSTSLSKRISRPVTPR